VTIDPLSGRLTGHGTLALDRADSHLRHAGKTVTASLAIRLPRSLAGRPIDLDVAATDRHHHEQVEPDLGAIALLP
jgi:hypothetical protein